MVTGIIGKKIDQTQAFLEDGQRVPMTRITIADNVVMAVRSADKNGYEAVQLGTGARKKSTKSQLGYGKGAKLEKAPLFLKEVKLIDAANMPEVGSKIVISEVLKPGDIIDVMGVSKGKGYAGAVKRHHFKGGPRTHGQSDRERAPGSIGQTTTPGRVYKGKRMAGRMGSDNVTIKNLLVLQVSDSELLVKGLVPGVKGNFVVVEKVGESKKFVPLFSDKKEEISDKTEEVAAEVQPEVQEEVKPEVQAQSEPGRSSARSSSSK